MTGIALSGVSKHFGAVEVIRDVSLDIEPGELVVFLGPSGSGKTTLLRMIAGLESIDQGTLTIDGVRSENLAPGRRNVAMVFQNYALYPHMTVAENMAFGLRNIRVAPDVIRQRIAEAARILEIEALLHRRPSQLSGGQRQRVMIAMALANNPDVLIADEPTTALDVTVQAQILNLIRNLQKELRMAVILITHDLTVVRKFSDYVYVMQHGEMCEHNVTERLFADPRHPYTQRLLASEPRGRPQPLPEGSGTILEADGVRVCFMLRHGTFLKPDWRELVAVDDLDLKLCRHETLGLVGESGSGKSVTARTVMGLLLRRATVSPKSSICYDGQDILKFPESARRKLRGNRISMIFQEPIASLNPCFTVGFQIEEVLRFHMGMDRAQR
ncbi:MAG: ABC transporter ATP-binding protein, partial [Mesorhizobium sp.]